MTGSAFNAPNTHDTFQWTTDGHMEATTSELVRQNKVHRKKFDITKSCDEALKQRIMVALHNDYMEVVANTSDGFTQTTTLELINYLYNSNETITPS